MRVELWPTWYDPQDGVAVPPAKIKCQTRVYFPIVGTEDEDCSASILEFQSVVNHIRKEMKRN